MTEQISFDLPLQRKLPIVDIIKMVLDRGELSKDDIRLLWDVSEGDHEVLKDRLAKEKLIEPGPKGKGGFTARFNKRLKSTTEELESRRVEFDTPSEETAAERLRDLLSHQEFEDLLGGPLVYTIRKARQVLTGEDRRGSKAELAAALLRKLGIDLLPTPKFASSSRSAPRFIVIGGGIRERGLLSDSSPLSGSRRTMPGFPPRRLRRTSSTWRGALILPLCKTFKLRSSASCAKSSMQPRDAPS